MNSEQAKKLSLPDILARLGHQPVKTLKGGNELWYKSPFRNEVDASFHTSFLGGKWIWNDFGDKGGTVLDFAMRYYNTEIKGALSYLDQLMGSNQQSLFSSASARQSPITATTLASPEETLSLHKINRLTSDSFNGRALMQYLTEKRGIDPVIASKYLVEVQYRNNETGKTYFAVGIKNEQEGYEIRNAYFKSSLGKKGVTIIKGKRKGEVAVFEGFMDFLSALTYYQSVDLGKFQHLVEHDTLIMNSASFHLRTKELLKASNYTKISLYLDNDNTGQNIKSMLEGEFSSITLDHSTIYSDYKDFNHLLVSQSTTGKNNLNHR
ncbi:Toprim domain-containing protein [Larkinella arboricola]|uniref:Toprim domain-containing protein n=1 Tax=Larkinella arboricola TaxID=643671 RepID=A0A327WH46_LARAB|nr:toprim domain-containing protein [Larkinella arboricola]RAJ89921.1 Toprim domain-containing protein [Larkinella arboricola]